MSVSAIIQRLEGLSELAEVEQPSRTNPLERDSYPVATVYPSAEQATEDGDTLGSMTRMDRTYLVLLTVDSAAALESVRDAVVAHLSSWKPAAGTTPLRYIEGKAENLNGSLIQWSLQFETRVCYG